MRHGHPINLYQKLFGQIAHDIGKHHPVKFLGAEPLIIETKKILLALSASPLLELLCIDSLFVPLVNDSSQIGKTRRVILCHQFQKSERLTEATSNRSVRDH